ncbi:MAG: YifB family Mg chelatase-like AAA ATPase [bacterium]|jgi:magnesium chelatase family protein|nr:YifB family Mg chelatase-like AAA ATPase [bacterium]
MPVRVRTGALTGIAGLPVSVEVVINRGLPGYHLVGLPGTEVRESRERVLSALRHGGVRVPPGRITVNLAPAGVRKSGASFDLAIALGIAAAVEGWSVEGAVAARLRSVFLGELSLFGELRPVRGLLPVLLDVAGRGRRTAIVPAMQLREAELVPGLQVVAARDLAEVLDWCRRGCEPERPEPACRQEPRDGAGALASGSVAAAEGGQVAAAAVAACAELARLTGQELARKVAVVAATGRHNLLLVGPPGAGKTRLARLLADLQPPLEPDEALTVTRIHSAAGLLAMSALAGRRPCRAPHHTVTQAGLLGGGPGLRPGEVTLAHGGLLFLDELAEFQPAVLDVLRQPLQEGHVTVSRGAGHRRFPAAFQLVAASNPCRCGYHGSSVRTCRCPPRERTRYLGRLSGPLLDRIDLFAEMSVWRGAFSAPAPAPVGAGWREIPTWEVMVEARRRLVAWSREAGAPQAAGNGAFMDEARRALGLSLRAVVRCQAVAATVAALDAVDVVEESHLREALEFRRELLIDPAG